MENFTKKEQVKKLDNVTLVLGNGFDLHNKLKTSYNNFFEAVKKESYYKIINEFNRGDNDILNIILNNNSYLVTNRILLSFLSGCNVWDIMFALETATNTKFSPYIRWADIEKTILKWMNDELKNAHKYLLDTGKYTNSMRDTDFRYKVEFLAAIIKYKNRSNPLTNSDDLYRYLLNELIEFERGFGEYIQKETDRVYGNNHELAYQAINKIVPFDHISTIASFNYNSYYNDRIQDKLHHINGGIIDHPIFGIDPSLLTDTSKDDPRIIFGKTYRRLMLDASVKSMAQKKPSRNIIIYGHSLNEQDYNYFFALFDDIDLADHTKDNKIIFAYSIHDEKRKTQITSSLIDNITKMFYNYSEYLGRVKDNNRLLDMLVVTKKIMLLEIPEESKNENNELN